MGILSTLSLARAQTVETWVSSDGAMFEASVKQVVPGVVTFVMKDGQEKETPLANLSERSRIKLVDVLGFGGVPIPAPTIQAQAQTPTGSATPAESAVSPAAVPSMPQQGELPVVDGTAIDATQPELLSPAMGRDVKVVGTVAKVITLGASGHQLIEFDSSSFNVFINKTQLDSHADWNLDSLPGTRLQVSGRLETYRDAPQIRAMSPAQLQRVR